MVPGSTFLTLLLLDAVVVTTERRVVVGDVATLGVQLTLVGDVELGVLGEVGFLPEAKKVF